MKILETKAVMLVILVVLFTLLGTYFTMIVPLMDESLNTAGSTTTKYTALQLKGKKIYQNEGCWYCHTQQVRNLLFDAERYGMGKVETYKRFKIQAHILAPPTQPGEIVYDKPHLLGTRRTGPDLARVGGKYDNTWHINHLRDPRTSSPGSLMPAFTWMFKNGQPTQDALALVAYLQKLGTNIKWREAGVDQYKKLNGIKEAEGEKVSSNKWTEKTARQYKELVEQYKKLDSDKNTLGERVSLK